MMKNAKHQAELIQPVVKSALAELNEYTKSIKPKLDNTKIGKKFKTEDKAGLKCFFGLSAGITQIFLFATFISGEIESAQDVAEEFDYAWETFLECWGSKSTEAELKELKAAFTSTLEQHVYNFLKFQSDCSPGKHKMEKNVEQSFFSKLGNIFSGGAESKGKGDKGKGKRAGGPRASTAFRFFAA